MFIRTHLANFPCGRKPEHPEKTHNFWPSVDWLFSHESVARITTDSTSDDKENFNALCLDVPYFIILLFLIPDYFNRHYWANDHLLQEHGVMGEGGGGGNLE